MLKPAPIVLLDEAAAFLDAENEVAVQNAIESLRRRRTVIVIAHHLPTVTAADRIFVLADGAVAEAGSHDELLALGGRYTSFWHERSRAAGWKLAAPPTEAPQKPNIGPDASRRGRQVHHTPTTGEVISEPQL